VENAKANFQSEGGVDVVVDSSALSKIDIRDKPTKEVTNEN